MEWKGEGLFGRVLVILGGGERRLVVLFVVSCFICLALGAGG